MGIGSLFPILIMLTNAAAEQPGCIATPKAINEKGSIFELMKKNEHYIGSCVFDSHNSVHIKNDISEYERLINNPFIISQFEHAPDPEVAISGIKQKVTIFNSNNGCPTGSRVVVRDVKQAQLIDSNLSLESVKAFLRKFKTAYEKGVTVKDEYVRKSNIDKINDYILKIDETINDKQKVLETLRSVFNEYLKNSAKVTLALCGEVSAPEVQKSLEQWDNKSFSDNLELQFSSNSAILSSNDKAKIAEFINQPGIQDALACGYVFSEINIQSTSNNIKNSPEKVNVGLEPCLSGLTSWGFAQLSECRSKSVAEELKNYLKKDIKSNLITTGLGTRNGADGDCPYKINEKTGYVEQVLSEESLAGARKSKIFVRLTLPPGKLSSCKTNSVKEQYTFAANCKTPIVDSCIK